MASMALLMHWLSSAEKVALAESDYSLHELALRWMEMARYELIESPDASITKYVEQGFIFESVRFTGVVAGPMTGFEPVPFDLKIVGDRHGFRQIAANCRSLECSLPNTC